MGKEIKQKIYRFLNLRRGFTLIELLVAIGIFVVITLIVTGIIVSLMRLNRANRQSRILLTSINTVMDAITIPARERVPNSIFFCRMGNESLIISSIYYPTWRYTADPAKRPVIGAGTDLYKKLCIKCNSANCNANNQTYERYGQSISFLLQTQSGGNLATVELLFYYKERSGNVPGGIYMSRCSPSYQSTNSVPTPRLASCSTFNKLITPSDIDIKKFYVVPIASNVDAVFSSKTAAQQGVQIIIEAQTMFAPIKTIHLQTAIAARQL